MADAHADQTSAVGESTQDKPTPSGKPVLSVKIYAPFQVYYEGEAYRVSAVNRTGPFDVLAKHHNFLCMLVPCTITVQTLDNKEKSIKTNRALMQVKAGRVVVFMDV